MDDLVVVGGGFAGLVCARSAALRGLRVTVLERKGVIGARPHTTGILVKEAAEAWEVPPRFTRMIRGVRLYAPSLRYIDLDSPGYYFLATDTEALLRWFGKEAQYAGARIVCEAPFRGAVRDADGFTLLDYARRTRFIVGADGARSRVAREFGLGLSERFLVGAEFEYDGVRGVDPDRLHCFLDSNIAPGYIAWVIAGVRGITQVGLACRGNHTPDVEAFRARLATLFDFSEARLVGRRGGLIPVGGRVAPFAADGVLLIGDAAGIVSPLTAGGIHTALDCGRRAGHAIADYLQDGGPAPGPVMRSRLPRFVVKGMLRRLFDHAPPNWVYERALSSPIMRLAAQFAYFHKRGPFSLRAWREGWTGFTPTR